MASSCHDCLSYLFIDRLSLSHAHVHTQGTKVPLYTESYGRWRKVERQQQCFLSPGKSWSERNDQVCESLWPSPRAGHAAVMDDQRGGMWIHGGYTTYYPYPRSGKSAASSPLLVLLHAHPSSLLNHSIPSSSSFVVISRCRVWTGYNECHKRRRC